MLLIFSLTRFRLYHFAIADATPLLRYAIGFDAQPPRFHAPLLPRRAMLRAYGDASDSGARLLLFDVFASIILLFR